MAREIDVVCVTDTSKVKTMLQEKVDEGWRIKGVIGYNPHKPESEPLIILERNITDETVIDDSVYQCEEMQQVEYYSRPEPKHDSASISVGND